MGTPGARLQGPFVSGSALALASWLPAPVATAPPSMTPRSSNARRCSRPLPATGSGGEDAKSCVRFLRMLMVLSLDRRIISQKPNTIPALMRARRDRPCGAAEQRDELAARYHSITSSARGEQAIGHCEAKRLGGLEVDRQLVLGRRLYRKVGRPLAFENAIDVTSGLPVGINRVWPITDQATGGDERAPWVGSRQSMSGCKRDDQIAIIINQGACHHDQPAIGSACKFSNGALNVFAILPTERDHLRPGQPCRGLNSSELADTCSDSGISDGPDPRHVGRNLLE